MNQLLLRLLMIGFLVFHLNAYWQQEVHYNIAVTLHDSDNTLTASERLLYINHSPDTLSGIWMHLWPNGYRNDKTALARERIQSHHTRFLKTAAEKRGWLDLNEVRVGAESLTWRTKGDSIDIAWFQLPKPLAPGDSVTINMRFLVKIPELTSRLGHIGQHYEITQWYPKPAVYDAGGWHPIPYRNWGEFYSEWGNFRVAITLPKNYVVAATGKLMTESEQIERAHLALFGNTLLDSMKKHPDKNALPDTLNKLIKAKAPVSSDTLKTIVFQQDRVHDFAWFADKQFLVTHTTTRVDSGRAPVDLWNYVMAKNFTKYRKGLTYLKTAVDSCSAWFMPYPYTVCTVVDGDISAGGGMEYPMITVVNGSGWGAIMDMTIFHEVAHNWFYGLAAFNERRYPWLDEGFTTYAERRHSEKAAPDNEDAPFPIKYLKFLNPGLMYDAPFYATIVGNLDQPADLPSDAFEGGNYQYMVYGKPSAAALMLQGRVGPARMDSAWHAFFRQWAYKHPQPADVRRSLEASLGMDLGWFFDGLIGSRAKMDYGISEVNTVPADSGWQTTLKLTNHGELTAPVPIVIRGANDYIRTVWVDDVATRKQITVPTTLRPLSVVLDPEAKTLDMNRVNDGSGIHLKFLLTKDFLSRGHGYTLRWMPGLWWNLHDRALLAFWLLHRNLDDPLLQWRINLKYGYRTNSWYTNIYARRRFYLSGATNTQLSTRWANNWYAPLAGLKGELLWRDPGLSFRTTVSGGYLYQDIKPDALTTRFLDSKIWQSGIYHKLHVSFSHENTAIDRKWSGEIHSRLGKQLQANTAFTRWSGGFNFERKLSPHFKFRWAFFAATTTGPVPTQELIYPSSDVDPDFRYLLVLSRTGYDWASPGNGFYLESLINIPGYGLPNRSQVLVAVNKLVGANVTLDFGLPLKFLIAGGMGKTTSGAGWEGLGSISPYLESESLPVKLVFPVAWIENGKLTGGFQFQVNLRQHFSFSIGNR